MTYITAIHVPIVGLALLPVLIGLPPLMLPVHVVLTEMVIDPACSLAFEGAPEDPNVMRRPPRGDDSIVGWLMLVRGLVQGACLLIATFGIYLVAIRGGIPEDSARSLAIIGLTLANVLLVAVNATAGLGWRSMWSPGFVPFWAVTGVAVVALSMSLALPSLRGLLHFGVPSGLSLMAVVVVVVVAVMVGRVTLHFGDARVRGA
jgi:Ca2+-transporting ATPase